jgi:ribosomal protein L11 methyltransferase
MDYIELQCRIVPSDPGNDIMIGELSDLGYDSFVEQDDMLLAYIPVDNFNESALEELGILELDNFQVDLDHRLIKDQNWNAKWEEDYSPVMIDGKVSIRAPFHDKPDCTFDIVIEPKMSFGTAHHPTTAQMIQLLLEKDVRGMTVLDMGSGTAVLAILAALKGAKHVDAIDNDEWAYNNARENILRNNTPNVKAELGDAALLQGRTYDFIMANINRNILLADLKAYSEALKSGGELFMSGFYEEDIPLLKEEAAKWGIEYSGHRVSDLWVASKWIKK